MGMRAGVRGLLLGFPPGASETYLPDFGEDAAIYGVSWTKIADPTLTRTDDAVGMVANAGVDGGGAVNDFDSADIFGEITEVQDALGNVFVRIPKFYIEKTDAANLKTWRISKVGPGETAYLPACFWNFSTKKALPYIYVGKHHASLDGSSRLESKANTYPVINKSIVNLRDYAAANGAGYQQMDIHVWDVLQTLFYIEFATLYEKSVMAGYTAGRYNALDVATATEAGANRIVVATATAALFEVGQAISVGTTLGGNQVFYGRTITGKTVLDASNTALDFDGDPVDIAAGNIVYTIGWRSGFSAGIASTSGSLVSNATGKYPCMYRGIENPWGSLFQFIDGVNINTYQAWVCRNAAGYNSALAEAPYEQLSYANLNGSGWIVQLGHDPTHPYAEFPVLTAGGAPTSYYANYYDRNSGMRIALGGSGGLAYWDMARGTVGNPPRTGGRLVYKGF